MDILNYIRKLGREFILRMYGFLHLMTKEFYRFREYYYGIYFLNSTLPVANCKDAPNVIYCFWTGTNDMSSNRIKSIEAIQKNAQVHFQLVTINNLSEFIKDGFPLHPAYEYLSDVHKADYLRCYFMHHWGGGYTDIKQHKKSWKKAFEKINERSDIIGIGYREFYFGTPKIDLFIEKEKANKLTKDLYWHYAYLLGNGSYIFKPYSPFTFDWITELHRRLDIAFDRLKANPGNVYGTNNNYPLTWSSILAQIFHPLCLKYHRHLLVDNRLRPTLTDYR